MEHGADSAAVAGPEVLTFGCRLNIHESEVMRRRAAAAGLADTVIVNTCAVTAEAVRQARQAIRRLRRERPAMRIVVTGCAAQTEPGTFAEMAEVDRVLGNDAKLTQAAWSATAAALAHGHDPGPANPGPANPGLADFGIPDFGIPDFGLAAAPKVAVNDIMALRETALHLVDGFEGRTRAFLQVQNGCDHRCTFCIIPFGRGNSRSVAIGEVVAQVRAVTEAGYREVVLTGVDITDYGRGLPGAPTLGLLVKQILRHVPELPRLRLSSIDAVEADRDLLDAIAGEPRLMPHLHLSLQAGDDLVLKRMKRRHVRADAVRLCGDLRRLRPDIAFGADIIAGFPTETEAMFARSLDLVDDCGLTHLHVFPFSPRPGTPAARMPQVAREVVKERARRLREKGGEAYRARLTSEVGARRRVLVENGGHGIIIGRTEHFLPVLLPDGSVPGTILDLAVTGEDGARLRAG